ncbi:hypothetical protein BDV11DRAFT_195360 [Aspergillus similis]
MFKALMGGGRSSSDVRSSTSSSSKSGSRRKSSHGHRSSASSTVSRKSSSRGDDRDRGLGDLSAYPAAGSRSRSVRYAESAAGESVASSYATARPNNDSVDHVYIEREPKRRESEYNEREGRERDSHRYRDDRDRDRDRDTDYERDRRKARPDREHSGERDRDSRRRERERERAYPGDNYYPPVASGAVPAPFDPVQATQGPPFPTNPVSVPPAAPAAPTPTIYDPHVQQQFPGQFPTSYAEPYRPPNPAGEAADYYNDQGQSVQEQPGVRPKPPLVIPNSQAHLMTASPTANPPPEPSSLGEVGAAASYFANDPALDIENSGHSTSGPESRPPKPSNPSQPPHHAAQAAGAMGAAAAAATYGVGSYSPEHVLTESPAAYVPPTSTNDNKPPHTQPHSHGVGTALGGAAAGAAAGYMLGHHHHSSSSSDHISQYTMQNPDDVSQIGPGYSSAPFNPTLYTAGAAGAAGAAYAASPLHPHHAAIYHGSPFQGGVMAFQQRQRGPLDKFIDFWRDPEGVGKFEDYTEAIGVCKYCFEPGTTSRDAPRTHHYRRRRSSDRLTGGSRVGKLSRYASSEDEGRRRKSKSSWLAAILGGYVAKSLFDSKDFDDSYSVKSGRVAGAFPESDSTSDMRSKTSRGVYKQLHRSHSRDRIGYRDQRPSRYEGSRINGRFRSRSRSSSRTNRHTLRDAAIGAAIGTAAASAVKSRGERSPSRSRSPSPHKTRGRKSSSSSGSSYENISQPAKKIAGGFGSFFTASSENRSKKRRNKRSKSIFSFYNSSSSSVDNDLAFGSGYARKLIGKSKRRSSKEKKEKDVDAKLLALGATATALAASSPRRSRRAGEVFVGQGSRSGRSDYTSSGSNDDDWEDLDSEGQASSVSSALAFGASGHFAREDSHSSDSSSPGWGWGWGTKSKKKTKNKSKRRSSSPKDRFHAGPATAVVAGALGTAALASGYHRGDKESSTSSASLQHVAPVPTSDPARYDAIPISSFPPSEPQLVRPGAIPLQQPQPVTPVSQAVYTSQGAPIPPFTAPIIPTSENPFPSYESQSRDADRKSSGYVERPSDVSVPKSHKRSESTPVIRSDPVQSVAEPVLGIKRRSTAKDQASVVQFDLTREQEDRERRAEHLERLRRDLGRGDRIELIDREGDSQSAPGEYGLQSGGEPDWVHEREREREREYLYERERRREREREQERERDYVPDSAGPIVSGAIGAAAASTIFSEGSSKDDVSDRSERRRERREQRRAERRQANGSSAVSSVVEEPRKGPDELPEHPEPRELMEERASSTSPSNNHVKTSAFRNVSRRKSVYDDYATFFYPEELRHSPDSHSRQGTPTMPTIVEIVPASERAEPPPPNPNADYEPPIDFKDFDRLPWPVPVLKVTGPTPPHSSSGSVRSAPSPVITPSEPAEGEKESERPNASRVSWGEHQTHEYEVPSTSSERSSVDLHEQQHDFPPKTSAHDDDMGYSYIAPSDAHVEDVNEDIQFAATVAAAAQAAGFDPALVTEDPIFRTRTSPPGSQTRERSISPTTIVSVTASHEPPAPQQFRGFVEGEVDSPSAPKSQFFSDPSTVIFDRPSPFENQPEWTWATDRPTTLDQPVVERVNKVETETGGIAKDVSRSVMGTRETQGGPFAERRQEPESPGEEEWFMPGGFEPEESKIERRSTSPTAGVPQSVPEEKEPEAGPEALKRTETKDTDDSNDSPEAAIGAENEGEGKKKKRRKRRSKGSDALDEPASFTSSVLTESSDKRKSTDDKSKKSGGFLASLFGSRVSEPVDSKGSRSTDKLVSREVQSEIGPATSEASPHRHTHRHRSSIDSRDPSRTDYDRDRHREFELHRAESFPVEGSRVSEPTTHKRSNSIDRLVSRDVQSEIGTRRSGNADSPRRRRHHHRTSSGGDSLDGRRKFDDPGLDKDGDGDGDDADKENVNLESYKSSRQRREERRRQRFGNGDGNGDGYEKV